MHSRSSGTVLPAIALAMFSTLLGCSHQIVGPELEPTHVARELGFTNCKVSAPMRRYQALDFADLIGNPNLADSPEWAKAISLMQPGDHIRHVDCQSGNNFFGLFRGGSVLFKFGSMLSN